mgnify:CR=1 FL=1
MIPRFAHRRPGSLAEAFAAWDAAGGDCAWYAGGTELLQVMKMGFARFGTLIDLKRIPELGGIAETAGGGLRIGAAVTHREVERSPLVARRLPGLVRLEHEVANVRVRSTGTLGGNLAFAEPHSDPATFLLACDARIALAGPSGTRTLAIGDFADGPLTTVREADELLVAIEIPAGAPGEGRAYAKAAFFERPAASASQPATMRSRSSGVSGGASSRVHGSSSESPKWSSMWPMPPSPPARWKVRPTPICAQRAPGP